MPLKKHGHNLLSYVLQPGRSITIDRYKVGRGQVTWRCDKSVAFALKPAIGSPHPDDNNLKLYNLTFTFLNNDICTVVGDYLGIYQDPSLPEVQYLGTLSEDPIETHPQFVSTLGGTASNPLNNAKFDADTEEFLGWPPNAPLNLGGVRKYLVPNAVVRITRYTASTAGGLNTLGDIASPPSAANVPSLKAGRNWLKTGWSREDFGTIYKISEEYTASGPGGWNSNIY